MKVSPNNPGILAKVAHAKGFTLVELLAVIAVMLIILRLTLPSLDGLLGGDAEGMARTQVVGELNRARQMALERGTAVYLVFMPLYDDISPYLGDKRAYFLQDKGVNALLGSQLASYAIYANYMPGDQPGNPSTKWLTDWKPLPAGHHFNQKELNWLPKVNVQYLKGAKPAAPVVKLALPCIKFNSRGEVESFSGRRELNGVYLSINKGGIFPPEKNQEGKYFTINGDVPESVPENGTKWLHVNGVTGRSEIKELTEEEVAAGLKLQNSKFQLHIISSPEYPPDFHSKLIASPDIVGWAAKIGAKYNERGYWAGPAEWDVEPNGRSYKSKTWPTKNILTPAFVNLPDRQSAVRLKWLLEKMVKSKYPAGRAVVVKISHQ